MIGCRIHDRIRIKVECIEKCLTNIKSYLCFLKYVYLFGLYVTCSCILLVENNKVYFYQK